jgi:PAS domain S-box-containing protein
MIKRWLPGMVGGLILASLPVPAQQPAFKIYTAADGLGHDRVYRIVSDKTGFLWFCTADGLTRFDGQHFLNFNSAKGAPFGAVNDLLEVSNGDYWIASRGQGLIHLASNGPLEPVSPGTANHFQPYRIGSDAASNYANVLHRDKSGMVWIGTNGGLYRLRERPGPAEIRPVPAAPPGNSDRGIEVFGLTEDPEGGIYAATNLGVARFLPDGRRVFYPFVPGYRTDGLGSMVFHDGVLWLGQPGGLFLLRPAAPSHAGPDVQVDDALSRAAAVDYPAHFTIPAHPSQAVLVRLDRDPARNYVFAIHELTGGRIWLASLGGMFEFSRGELRGILKDMPFSYALEIGQDAAGNMWLSANGSGAAKVESRGFASFGRADGLGAVPIAAAIDRAGNAIVPNWPRQLSIFSGERFKTIELKLDPKADFTGMRPVLQDRTGGWWAATSRGLYRFPEVNRPQDLANVSPTAVFTRSQGLGDDEVSELFEDEAGDIWAGGSSSLQPTVSRWERRSGRLFRYSISDGLPAGGDRLTGIVQDSDKSVWFAFSEGGLARYREGHFRLFGEAQGLPSSKTGGITVDRRGRVWCSIVGHGLVRIEDSSGPQLTLKTYSVTERVERVGYNEMGGPLFADAQGRIYIGLSHGVDRLDPSTGAVTHYGPAEGVPAGPIRTIAGDGKGAIWISTKTNIVRIVPDSVPRTPPSPVLISGLRVSGVDYEVSATGARSLDLGELPDLKNSLQIDFLCLSFTAGQSPLFQYQLDGAGSGWSASTPLGTVNYANLSPGKYRFEVRQVLSGEDSPVAPAQLTFRILQPFWKRGWFIGSVLFTVLGSLVAFDRYRAAKLRQLRSAMAALRGANEALDVESAIGRILAQATGESAFPSLLETLCRRTGWNRGVLWERDRETTLLHRAAEWPSPSGGCGSVLAPGRDLAGYAADSRQLQWVAVPAGHAAFPILVGDLTLGVIEFHSNDPRNRDAQAATLGAISGMIGQWMERLRAEGDLRTSEARFRTLAETASDAIVTIDEQGEILFCNASVSDVFGYPTERMVGQGLTMLMPPRLREAHSKAFERYLKTGERRISWKAVELPGLHADGHEISLELSFGEFTRAHARLFTAVIRDISERKRTEEALRRSREERIAEIERVRRRIATDLHDDIGSSLTQISVLSEVARRQVAGSAAVERPLEIIAGSARELIDSMSDIVWAINPQRDHLADLAHRMRRFAADTLTARNIAFTLELPDSSRNIRLEGNLRREVFLIFKEALNNAIRHSGATRAEIGLHLEDHSLRLHVRDNGKGFDTSCLSDGHGLTSMSSRASEIGARFEITSQPGEGSAVHLEVPLNTP